MAGAVDWSAEDRALGSSGFAGAHAIERSVFGDGQGDGPAEGRADVSEQCEEDVFGRHFGSRTLGLWWCQIFGACKCCPIPRGKIESMECMGQEEELRLMWPLGTPLLWRGYTWANRLWQWRCSFAVGGLGLSKKLPPFITPPIAFQ